jgi:hypothetical protein
MCFFRSSLQRLNILFIRYKYWFISCCAKKYGAPKSTKFMLVTSLLSKVQRARCICKEENLAPCAYYSKSQVVHTGWEFLQVWMSVVSYKKSQRTRHGLAACCTPKLHIPRQCAPLSPSLFKYSQLDECKNGNKYSGDRRAEINHPGGKLDFAQDTFDSPAPTCFCA